MYWELEMMLFALLLTTAVFSLRVKDLLSAVVILSVYSFIVALICVAMGAVDVGFTEAVVGAGVTSILLILAVYHTDRRSID